MDASPIVTTPLTPFVRMIKLWFRLATMNDSPHTKKIFKWSLELANKGESTWCFHANKV